jgi:ABC-type oligopeptide transport system substrate-binding subunit
VAKAEEIFLNDLPLIPILYYKTKHMVSKRVQGWATTAWTSTWAGTCRCK